MEEKAVKTCRCKQGEGIMAWIKDVATGLFVCPKCMRPFGFQVKNRE